MGDHVCIESMERLNLNENGIDCYADYKDSFNDFAKYFNNQHLSDVLLKIGTEQFAAHKIVLCRSSEVFDRMLSKRWTKPAAHELKLTEDADCQSVFRYFLKFLYSNHILLNDQNTLPLLILSDKYGVHGLRKVCVEYATKHILPFVNLKTLIHIWFKYATTAYHCDLIRECVQKIAKHFWHIISDEEWNEDWISLDRDQLIELLKSSENVVPNEFVLWEAVLRWFNSSAHPQRRGQSAVPLIQQVLPLIRFPYMSADELDEVESSSISIEHPNLLKPLTHLAFKFASMTLGSRAKSSEFNGIQFLIRNYMDIRWDKRIAIPVDHQLQFKLAEHRYNITTRSSTFPIQHWEWELAFVRNGNLTNTYSSITSPNRTPDELSIELKSIDLDQQRSVEYMLNIVNDKEILMTFSGRKTFTKSRTTETLELEDRLTVNELFGDNKKLLHNGELHFQLILRPIV